MHRRTKDPRTALGRLEGMLGETVPTNRTSIRRLAFLADIARRKKRADAPSVVRWTGRVPARGVKGWEAEALEWLRLEL